jgi:hypothetical protein
MKATKREQELLAKVEELEKAHENLMFDLDWQKLIVQKRFEYFLMSNRKNGKGKRGPQQGRKMGTKQGTENRDKLPVDAFGNRQGTQGSVLNSFIVPLIERGQVDKLKPEILSQMSGGQFSKGRFADHLRWLRRHNYI